jgi:hypothetical protein
LLYRERSLLKKNCPPFCSIFQDLTCSTCETYLHIRSSLTYFSVEI